MKKCLLLILITIALIPAVAAMTIEISEDNSTWENIGHYGGRVSDINKSGFVLGLEPCTTYYFRANDSTATNATYLEQRTDCDSVGGVNVWELAIVLGILIPMLTFFAGIFMIGRTKFSEQIKIFLVGMVLLFNLILVSIIYQFAEYGPVVVDPATNTSSFPDIMGTITTHYQFVNYLAYIIIGIIVIFSIILIIYKFAKMFTTKEKEKEDD